MNNVVLDFSQKIFFDCFKIILKMTVFGIAQKSTSNCSFIAQIFFSELTNNNTTTYQKLRKAFFIVFFKKNLENHSKISTFSMIFTFYLRHLDLFLSF
jgi:hypothetical protein